MDPLLSPQRRMLGFVFLAVSTYVAGLVFFLWPWSSDPARLAIGYPDLLLFTWLMAWIVHQAVTDPLNLFDANIFWPTPGALSHNETLFPQAAMGAPILWLGGGPLLAHNLVLFATIVMSGVAAALLTFRLTRSREGALIAGFAYAFCPFRFHHLVQISVSSYQWFPLVLLGVWSVAAGPDRSRRSSLVLFGLAAILQALSSGYYAVLLTFMIATALAFLSRRLWRKGRLAGVLVVLAMAAGVALLAGLPSVMLRQRQAVSRGTEGPIHWSAVPRSYVDPGQSVRALGLRESVERTSEPLFAGFAPLALALAGLALSRHRPARAFIVCVGFVCAAMAFGPLLRDLPFEMRGPFDLVRRLPPADMIRVPSRFGIGAILAIDVMAGLGFAAIARHIAMKRRALAAVAVLIFMTMELRPSIARNVREVPPPPPYTKALASLPRASVLELPWRTEEAAGIFLYWSTAHWQPLVNGFATFPVPQNFELAAIAQNFPTGFAARALRCAGVRYVVVHGDLVEEPQRRRALDFEPPGTRRLGQYGQDFLFELSPWTEGVTCAPELPRQFRRP